MLSENETRYDAAKRCARHSLGIKSEINFVQYKTFDNVDRTPYGRMIAFGMLGIHYGDNIRMSAGGIASEIKLIDVGQNIQLVYDHSQILRDAFAYINRIHNNFTFISELFPEDMPLKYIRKLMGVTGRVEASQVKR